MAKLALIVTIVIILSTMVSMAGEGQSAKSDGPKIAHMVYFTLKDNSTAEVQKLVDACNKYLTKHDGEVAYSVGIRAAEFKREVNDKDFDVAVNFVFANKEALEKYSASDRHQQFIKEWTGKHKKVRVFDSNVSAVSEGKAEKKDGPQLAHTVFFTLKDNSPAEAQNLVDQCQKYLSKQDGEVFFAVGSRGKEFKRDVNDQDFDVVLFIVFANREAHDRYQTNEQHMEFKKAITGKSKKERIFDSFLSK